MTEINSSKFYQFLASKYDKEGSNWINEADKNNDGYIIKSEFRAFMQEKFDWNGETDNQKNDLINSFWKKLDTNTSATKISGTKLKNLNALDKNEAANLEKKIEAYVQFDQFIADNVEIPSVLATTGARWKSDVVDDLAPIVEKYCANGYKDDLDLMLLEALPLIANTNTAIYCNVEYQDSLKSTVLAQYPDYKEDAILDSIIKNYISSVGADATAETIKTDIRAIVDEYFSTAGLCESSGYDLSEYGYKSDSLNEIQKTVIEHTIKNNLAEEAKNYEKYSEKFNSAVQEFIDSKLKEGGDFETLKACAGEFMNSEFKAELDDYINTINAFKDINLDNINDNKLYQALVEKIGETQAKRVMQAIKEKNYDSVIESIMKKVEAGEFRLENGKIDLDAVFADFINKYLEKADFSKYDIKDLNKIYANQLNEIKAQSDGPAYKTKAIEFCKTIVKKGGDYAQAVKDIFGDDYASKINSQELISDVEALVNKLIKWSEQYIPPVTDRADEIKNNNKTFLDNFYNIKAIPDFNMDSYGYCRFESKDLEAFFYTGNEKTNSLKSVLEGEYADILEAMRLSDAEKEYLFSQALFMALHEREESMYTSQNMHDIASRTVDYYCAMIVKIGNDDKAMTYFKESRDNSILKGASAYGGGYNIAGNISNYYVNRITKGGDNWASINGLYIGNAYGEYTYAAVAGNGNDAGHTNSALQKILADYVSRYSSNISTEQIVNLYNQAILTAYGKCTSGLIGASKAYQAEESGLSAEGFYIQFFLTNVMYEMEALLNQHCMM